MPARTLEVGHRFARTPSRDESDESPRTPRASLLRVLPEDSSGRFKAGESEAIVALFDTMDARPGLFSVLAPQDHGADNKVLETDPSRQALARRNTLTPLLTVLEALTPLVSDDVMSAGEHVKDVSVPAYALIKANAAVGPKIASTASAALDFYGAPSRARKAKKAKSARASK